MSYICYIAFIESDYFLWVKKTTKYLYQKVYFSTYIFQQRTANNETKNQVTYYYEGQSINSDKDRIKQKLYNIYVSFRCLYTHLTI